MSTKDSKKKCLGDAIGRRASLRSWMMSVRPNANYLVEPEETVMNYRRIYQQLIERARTRVIEGYVERHHVIPKCLGGADEPENLVQLTPEEHFFAHVLLVKIHPEDKNLIVAVHKMTRGHKGRRSRKLYGWLKRKFAVRMRELQSGEGNSQFGSRWINDGNGTAKKHRGELPLGWLEGRTRKRLGRRAQRNLYIDSIEPIRSVRVGAGGGATEDEIQKALDMFHGDIRAASKYLGYKKLTGCSLQLFNGQLVKWQTRQP